jgi:hypothetical protein
MCYIKRAFFINLEPSMFYRRKALLLAILLTFNQAPAHAAFNMVDGPEPAKMPPIDTYPARPLPKAMSELHSYPQATPEPRLYPQASYRPAAYSQYDDPPLAHKPLPEPLPSADSPGVVETGLPDMNVPVIKRSGSNKPLPDALRAILPRGWHARKKANVSRRTLISWESGWDWVTTLDDVANEYGLSVIVDWNTQTVTVVNQLRRLDSESTPSLERQYRTRLATGAANTALPPPHLSAIHKPEITPIQLPAPETAVSAPAKFTQSLQLLKGQKMSESLDTWAKNIGWNLVWDSKTDYPITVTTAIGGNTDEILTKFGDALVHSHQPLHVDVYKANKVIRITN